jgi:mono/diheme cytochrome c family protein
VAAKRSIRPALVALVAAVAVIAAGCGAVNHITNGQVASANIGEGKALFMMDTLPGGKPGCATCHTLADAGTSGTVGPNLDNAFRYDKLQGFKLSTIRDVVRGQIAYATSVTGADEPGTTTPSPGMPDNLLRGEQARDVAVYVAQCAAVPHCGVTAATTSG